MLNDRFIKLICKILLNYIDILTKSLVNEALEWDVKENVDKAPKDRESKHLTDLLTTIRELGISFNVWEKKNADGKASNIHDFTSLMGSDKKRLLKYLPDKLDQVIKPNNSASVIQIWRVIY